MPGLPLRSVLMKSERMELDFADLWILLDAVDTKCGRELFYLLFLSVHDVA